MFWFFNISTRTCFCYSHQKFSSHALIVRGQAEPCLSFKHEQDSNYCPAGTFANDKMKKVLRQKIVACALTSTTDIEEGLILADNNSCILLKATEHFSNRLAFILIKNQGNGTVYLAQLKKASIAIPPVHFPVNSKPKTKPITKNPFKSVHCTMNHCSEQISEK